MPNLNDVPAMNVAIRICEEFAEQWEMQARSGDNTGASDHRADAARQIIAELRNVNAAPSAAPLDDERAAQPFVMTGEQVTALRTALGYLPVGGDLWERTRKTLYDLMVSGYARAASPQATATQAVQTEQSDAVKRCDGSGAIAASVDDWSECPKCNGAGCTEDGLQSTQPAAWMLAVPEQSARWYTSGRQAMEHWVKGGAVATPLYTAQPPHPIVAQAEAGVNDVLPVANEHDAQPIGDQLTMAAINALRSYQYGNSSPDLAESVADKLSAARNGVDEAIKKVGT